MCKISLILFLIALSLSVNAQKLKTYVPGYYFDNNGKKFTGTIMFAGYPDRFFFKAETGASSKKIKIKIEQVSAVVADGDSVTVMTEDNNANRRYFAKLKMATPTARFYTKYGTYNVGYGQTFGVSPGGFGGSSGMASWGPSSFALLSENLTIMYQEGNTTFQLTKKNYITVLSKAFADVPEMEKLVQDKELKFKNIEEIFKRYCVKTQYNGG